MSWTVDRAFRSTPRAHFLPPSAARHAEEDRPLSIGYGQTGAQPTTVKLMLNWLKIKSGHKVLEVGSGSGWTTALLCRLVGPKGHVIALERIPQLLAFGRSNCESLGLTNIAFCQAGETLGMSQEAPYDRILVNAVTNELPAELVHQLASGGRMVLPIRDTIQVIEKDRRGHVSRQEHVGFAFVPLVQD